LSRFVYANSYGSRGFFSNSRARDIPPEPKFRALDAVQDGEQRIEVHGWEGPTRPIEALYDCMRSATGVELEPRGRLSLHEFRWPAADHELGQDAQELPSRSSDSDVKISISGLSSLRAAEITSRYMAGSLAIRTLMPLAPVSWPRPLGGTSRP
jgi:hypothetical protein